MIVGVMGMVASLQAVDHVLLAGLHPLSAPLSLPVQVLGYGVTGEDTEVS